MSGRHYPQLTAAIEAARADAGRDGIVFVYAACQAERCRAPDCNCSRVAVMPGDKRSAAEIVAGIFPN